MQNHDLRLEAAGAGIRLWQIAEVLGITDSSLSRKLRRELPDNEKAEFREAIWRLKKGGAVNENVHH